jgi:hypothetical protein
MALFQNFTPEARLALAAGVLGGSNIGTGLSQGLQTALPIMESQKQKTEAEAIRNKTALALRGLSPELSQAVQDGIMEPSAAYSLYLKQQQAAKEAAKPKYVWHDGKMIRLNETTGENSLVADYSGEKKRNLISTRNGIYDADSQQWITPPEGVNPGDSVDYGLNPIWFKDQDGKYKLGVPGKDGSFKILPTPENMEPLPGVNNVDQGTFIGVQDKKTGDTIRTMEKDVAGQKEQEKLGAEIGAIKAALPSARVTAAIVAKDVEDLKKDAGLAWAVGPVDSRFPTMFPSTARAESKIDKLKGSSFLQAREMLRGGGQITDFEGQRAEAAIARLSTAQNEEDFKDALDEYNSAVQEGLKKLEAVAAGNLDFGKTPTADQKTNPQVDSLVEQYRTK